MSDYEDERPSLGGGLGFNPGRRKMEDAEEDGGPDSTPYKKKMRFDKTTAAPASTLGGPSSFAAKMMAKMGYKEGQGLGASGRGRLAPIETQTRPQGAGLGAVKEKTKQAKEEERREAAFRGEVLEDSSDEEKKRRRKQRERKAVGGLSGSSTPGGSRPRPKIKYRTATEIEAEAEGLLVPNVLKNIIDINGRETKLLSSTHGLLTPGEGMVPSETEAVKIARRARRDLEAFADEWTALSERQKYFDLESSQLITEIDVQLEEISGLRSVVEAVQQLQDLSIGKSDEGSTPANWEAITKKLEAMEVDFKDNVTSYGLQEVAVAAVHPLFRSAMLGWDPVQEPTHLVPYLQRLQHILGIDSDADDTALALQNGYTSRPSRKSTTHYETLIYTLWLPPVRTAIANAWDVYDPTPMTTLVSAWRPLLPPFVLSNVMDQLIAPRLTTALVDWKPSGSRKKHRHGNPPHIWLFPWLPYLSPQHLDPTAPSGLLTDVKRKLRSLLSNVPLEHGIPPYLPPWDSILSTTLSQLLTRHLLPRLSTHLGAFLEIDPSDQDLTPLTQVLAFAPLFPPSTTAELLAPTLFPKFHATLHLWLTSSPNYTEIGQWFQWWKAQIPPAIATHPAIEAEWTKALSTINHALELGDLAPTAPPAPSTPAKPGPTPARPAATPASASAAAPVHAPAPALTFRTIVEDWCAEHELLVMPLRRPHGVTGEPLFRITASASARGKSVTAYVRGDVLWVQNARDREAWDPVGLDEELVVRAGGEVG